ncbi:MAG TPA: DUF362 domain-containing protein [Verrucomicrobiae bacterium]
MRSISRRRFLRASAVSGVALSQAPVLLRGAEPPPVVTPEPLQPVGEAKGVHPGRVVWVHDPQVLNWAGPGNGHWYQNGRTGQERVDQMMAKAVMNLTGETSVPKAWERLFRHYNRGRGKEQTGYRPGEKILIKPNWVGMIWREGAVDPETYTLIKRQDYMNTSPQMIISLLRQLTQAAAIKQEDITVSDTLAYLVNEYYEILHQAFPGVHYTDYAGKFGREKVKASTVPFFWSCRPVGKKPDFLPTCITEASYLVNFATFKAHVATGVTLCGKNHFGSLVRWPVEEGYHDLHQHSFSKEPKAYRDQVDLMGHAHLGGKTVLYLVDGLFSGKHPIDPAPRKMSIAPFNGDWPKSLFASQDPVAIDSVAYDFLWAEYDDLPRKPGVDDYLHEAAQSHQPPSGTFYDPDHAAPASRLACLGVHEHWNNARDKKYSRNLGTGKGIELVQL